MGTKWAEIVSNYAMLLIDDIRLQDEAAENPAAFLRKMSIYVSYAIPLLCEPPELLPYLEDGLVEPVYDDYGWTSTQESTEQETVVHTGLTGFGLFSCVIRTVDAAQNVSYTPYTAAAYDPETGDVTFPVQSAEGIDYSLDFYTDGFFAQELSRSIKNLLGLAVAVGWDERFNNTWLNFQMKLHDKSFDNVNESNYMRASSERHSAKYAEFCAARNKYAQDCAYMQVTPRSARQTRFV